MKCPVLGGSVLEEVPECQAPHMGRVLQQVWENMLYG